MMTKKKSTFILLLFLLLLTPHVVFSLECEEIVDKVQKISCLNKKVKDLGQTANSLRSQIQYMDTQIYLAELKITDSENKIQTTQKEIEKLDSKIEGLDMSLNYLSKLLLKKIVEGYKQKPISIFDLILNSENANDFLGKIKYLKSAQDNNQKLLIRVQEAKLNFEEQKVLREEKKIQLNNLKITLAIQQNDLQNQQLSKKNILTATNNDETTYQNLLEKARQELAGFSAFTQSAGGGLTTFGNGSNGWYYTQRDPQWGNMILPGSSSSIMLAGCAVSSVAMVCKSYGQNVSPSTITNNPSNFIYGDLWNWAFTCDGKTTDWIGSSQELVKSYVNNNIPVVLRLVAPSVSGLHFIVAFAWDSEKNDFKIHDPYYGPDKYFSEQYNWSQVTTAVVIH